MGPKKTYYPVGIIAIFIIFLFGICNLCQVFFLKDNYPLPSPVSGKLPIGSDYCMFFGGTETLMKGFIPPIKNSTYANYISHVVPSVPPESIMQGNSPYATAGYWFPPILAYINYPIWLLGLETAQRVMFFILLAAVISAYALINTCFQDIYGKDKKIIFLYGLCIIFLSFPVYFLIARGHMIGITFLLLAAGIYLLKKNNPVCGICFGLSIGIFVFPVLILVPLFLFRRYKILLYTLLTLFLLFLVCPEFWLFYIKNILLLRVATGNLIANNCSLANTFNFFYIFFNKIMATGGIQFRITHLNEVALAVYAVMFSTVALADYKIRKKYGTLDIKLEIAFFLMYFPFMIAVPKICYPYNLVLVLLLIPAFGFLVTTLTKPMPKIIFWLFVSGIALSQMQAQSFQTILNTRLLLFHFFPAFGLLLVMMGCVFFKLWFWLAHKEQNNIATLT